MVSFAAFPRPPNIILLLGAMALAVVIGLWQASNYLSQEMMIPYTRRFSSLTDFLNQTGYVIDSLKFLEKSHLLLAKELRRIDSERDAILQKVSALESDFEQKRTNQEMQLDTVDKRLTELAVITDTVKGHLSLNMQLRSLKDTSKGRGDHIWHYFMSVYEGRGMAEGPPQLFSFPSDLSEDRILCLLGNDTSDGVHNFYGLAYKHAVPPGFALLDGVTLLSDTYFDFMNPWHAMYNLFQFIYWKLDNGCRNASRLALFHKGEFRTVLGGWISNVLRACRLPTNTVINDNAAVIGLSGALRGIQQQQGGMCFETAIVSRSGIGGMEKTLMRRMFAEARCQARAMCGVTMPSEADEKRVNVTLIVRAGGRGFADEGEWKEVVKEQCDKAPNCSWSAMYVADLTFCQQVEAMSYTNVLVSAHGAQLTNMIFMSPGGRVMELFPSGWLELAGHGQYIYGHLAEWLGLIHEGIWRDPSTTPCPNWNDTDACFTHYKDQPLSLNRTHISTWLGQVISNFVGSRPSLSSTSNHNANHCECPHAT